MSSVITPKTAITQRLLVSSRTPGLKLPPAASAAAHSAISTTVSPISAGCEKKAPMPPRATTASARKTPENTATSSKRIGRVDMPRFCAGHVLLSKHPAVRQLLHGPHTDAAGVSLTLPATCAFVLNDWRSKACNLLPVIPDIDIWRAATLMLKRYGDKALEESAVRADELAAQDDHNDAAVWRRITDAVGQLGNTVPSGPLH